MDFRNESGDLVDNVTIHDMGIKSVGNDLDNAWIHFDNVELPRSAMLNRYANIDADGQYVLNVPGIRPFDVSDSLFYILIKHLLIFEPQKSNA